MAGIDNDKVHNGVYREDSGTSSCTGVTWQSWVGSDLYHTMSVTSKTTDYTPWIVWQYKSFVQIQQPYVVPQISEEERQRREHERIRMEELAREREKKARGAEEKALQLLLENLTENQAKVYKLTEAIPVECQSGRKYHIRKGISSNVHELDEKGGTKSRLCFHPTNCPVYDVMLAQKLMLEVCEEDARKVANFS